MSRIQIGLGLRPAERERLADYAARHGQPTLSAALRSALPEVFFESAKEGRPLGYSPKRGKKDDELTA